MHLTTGILKVALTELRKPRMERMEDGIEVTFRVWPSDLDINIHMNNAKYPVAMEVGRWAFLFRAGLVGPTIRERWAFVLAAQNIIFFRPLRLFQRFTVSARVLHADHGWLYFEQKVRSRGKLVAIGLFRMRIKRGRDTVSPRDVARAGGYELPRMDEPAMLRAWNDISDALLAEKRGEDALARGS